MSQTVPDASITSGVQIEYLAPDNFRLDINGFGGPTIRPSDKLLTADPVYDRYITPEKTETSLFRDGGQNGTLLWAGLGTDAFYDGLCFFAVGLDADTLPTATTEYWSLVDGLAQIDGQVSRLFGSEVIFTIDPGAGRGTMRLKLRQRGNPFGNFLAQPAQDLITINTALTYNRQTGSFAATSLNGGGYSGELHGQLVGVASQNVSGRGGAGAVSTFVLRGPKGEVIYGAIASGANLI